MAGDWIKIEKATVRKTEVLHLASLLGIHPDQAFGLCFRFWSWVDDNLTESHAKNVTPVTLNFVIGHDGFAESLIEVGWLQVRNGSLEVPNFDRHLSQGAKSRALAAERQQKQRFQKSQNSHDSNVTIALLEKRREDKSKEDKERESIHTHDYVFPAWQIVKAAADNMGLPEWRTKDWFDEMESVGWKDKSGRPLTRWQSGLSRVKGWWESDGRPMERPKRQSFDNKSKMPMSSVKLQEEICGKLL